MNYVTNTFILTSFSHTFLNVCGQYLCDHRVLRNVTQHGCCFVKIQEPPTPRIIAVNLIMLCKQNVI